MKLQKKSLLVLVGLLIMFLLVISIFFSTILLASYSALEEQYVAKDLNQAVNKLNDELFTMSSIASDWGPWDDTVDFVNGKDPEYLNSNLQPYGFDNLNLNLIVMTNTKGEVLFSAAYDLKNKVMVPVPAFFSGQLDLKNPLMNMSDPHQITTGILMLQEDPMLVVSQPIVQSDFSGPPQGVIIMGRYLNKEEIARLAELTRPSLALTRIGDPALSPNLVSEIRKNSGSPPGIIQQLNGDQVAGYALIQDIYGNDALVLEITEARDIYQRGINTTVQVILIILSGGLFLGLVVIILLDRVVLKRIGSLALQVHAIGRSGSTGNRVEMEGDDELSGLAREINLMLDTIQKFHLQLGVSELRFRELSDLLPQIIFELDVRFNLTYINKYGLDLFGLTEKDLEHGLNARQFLIPKDIERMVSNLKKAASGEKSPGYIYTLVKKDNSLMQAMLFSSPIFHEGRLEGFRGSGIDISERIQLENSLEESTKLMNGILQASPVGVFRLDSSGHVTFVNETFTKITGIAFETIRGTYWADILSQSERERVIKEIEDSIRDSRRMSSFETRYIHPDGTPYWLFGQTVPVKDKEGSLNGWVGTLTDITAQKFIEDSLKESEEKYRALTENTPDILFSTDMAGIITYVSPQVNKYGFLVEEVIGKSLRMFIHPADIDQVENNLSRELEKGAQFVSRFRILDKWGSTYWFEEKSSLRLDLSGNPIGIYGILRDVTDRKRIEDAIDIANKKLNLMNQITRHDILNTITGLLGCVDMAKATHSPEEREQLFNDISELTRVIQSHITFTREYQEVGVHMPQWQNVNTLLNKEFQNFEKSVITFSSEIETLEIYADPLLEKVFYNLIENAIRHGETITTISVSSGISDKGFSLVFEDDGVGVRAGQKQEIFKRGVGKNTGMGLFLTAEILSITGITIEENGIFGKGARFEIRIPNGTWRLFKA